MLNAQAKFENVPDSEIFGVGVKNKQHYPPPSSRSSRLTWNLNMMVWKLEDAFPFPMGYSQVPAVNYEVRILVIVFC